MKILILISTIFTVAVAQEPSLSCNYFSFINAYSCRLSIDNPNGFNNFTEIGGIHLEGFTNEDVTEVYRMNGISSIVPSIICETFPRLDQIILSNTGLTEIGDTALSGCLRLRDLYLDGNLISTLPENVFASQQSLTRLDLSNNPFNEIPGGVFRPLLNLMILQLRNANINTINNQWFAANSNLRFLYLTRNGISLSTDTFIGMEELRVLDLGSNAISEVPVGAFVRLPKLFSLFLHGNNFTELQADSFQDLSQLNTLDISFNPIEVIHDKAFRGISNLTTLIMNSCRLRHVQSSYFDELENLRSLSLDFNEIEELPEGVFVSMSNLDNIGLANNRLKAIRRNSFGILTSLQTISFHNNIVNAVERSFIDEAVNLNILFFVGNLCASGNFLGFLINRDEHLLALETCFRNTVTEADGEYFYFEAPQPGIVIRVNTSNEVQIALSPFNTTLTPIIEIIIGTENNTRSIIRLNQESNVVNASTPNIIIENQWNDFRVTWANQVILVFSSNDTFPFMGFTMPNFFPISFYGLRSVETRATWTVRPLE